MKITVLFFVFIFWATGALALPWPESPWLNRTPQTNASASLIAFVSPYDLQFYRVMKVWTRLEKKYGSLGVNFLIVSMNEQGLPFGEDVTRGILRDRNYYSPVFLDANASFSKNYHVYASPTLAMVSNDGKTTVYDQGSFEPTLIEKNLQKVLKENLTQPLPAREFPNDNENKNCGHPHTVFVGERFGKAWSPDIFTIQGSLVTMPFWIESTASGQIDVNLTKSSVGVLAEAVTAAGAKVIARLDGQKIPSEVRGKDIQEDKLQNTFLLVKNLKAYEILAHGAKLNDGQKLTLLSEGKGLRLRAFQTLPYCLEVE